MQVNWMKYAAPAIASFTAAWLRAQAPATLPVNNPAAELALRTKDYQAMLDTLKLTLPTLPTAEADSGRPAGLHPTPNGRWTDAAGNQVVRSAWGTWSNFDDFKANLFPIPDPLRMKNGLRVPDAKREFQAK